MSFWVSSKQRGRASLLLLVLSKQRIDKRPEWTLAKWSRKTAWRLNSTISHAAAAVGDTARLWCLYWCLTSTHAHTEPHLSAHHVEAKRQRVIGATALISAQRWLTMWLGCHDARGAQSKVRWLSVAISSPFMRLLLLMLMLMLCVRWTTDDHTHHNYFLHSMLGTSCNHVQYLALSHAYTNKTTRLIESYRRRW